MKRILIKNIVMTEKSVSLASNNRFTLKVAEKSNKSEIKKNLKKLFNVDVIKINVIKKKSRLKTFRRTTGLARGYKKVIVTLPKNQKIDGFEIGGKEAKK